GGRLRLQARHDALVLVRVRRALRHRPQLRVPFRPEPVLVAAQIPGPVPLYAGRSGRDQADRRTQLVHGEYHPDDRVVAQELPLSRREWCTPPRSHAGSRSAPRTGIAARSGTTHGTRKCSARARDASITATPTPAT